MLAPKTAAFLEGVHLLWLLDPEQVDLVAVHRSYVDGLAARLRGWAGRRGEPGRGIGLRRGRLYSAALPPRGCRVARAHVRPSSVAAEPA